ncbi:Stage II sporulation protein E (SpoIIE) [Thermostaphylospora chromogena]|uniref:Stage II sporulation protein E (SpoIIE) n=1 Tax=Thermostaphylospora chromogena TaxID=35622 RepID=A0A1H1HIB9_9ACTN|nr:Stage II sporulation protein E (SpoIIE) [Thermostaphylospora chromogena]
MVGVVDDPHSPPHSPVPGPIPGGPGDGPVRNCVYGRGDRRVSLAMREAILSGLSDPVELPHADVAVRYVPAGGDVGLGGDWYEASVLPDGRVLLAVGDVAGHGMPVISQMMQLRHALLGLSMTGLSADRLLFHLNDLVRYRLDGTTATAVVGHLDPESGEFTWSQAGHPPPILVRDGVAGQLVSPEGVLLGADEWAYEAARVRLREGDLLLLFTDGLVERRHSDIDAGLSLALTHAAALRPGRVEEGLDRMLAAIGVPNAEDDACLLALTVGARP